MVPYNVFMCEMRGQSEGYPTDEVLEPLTEQYDEAKHSGIYNLLSNVLCDALEADKSSTKSSVFSKVRNIALSGGYGTGKSSVLCAFKDDPRFQDDKGNSNCLFISLSSLNGQGDKSSDNGQGDSEQTDLIEKEIVKQLLYQESSAISHFRRLRSIKPKRRWLYSIMFGLLMFLLCTGLGWTGKIRSFFSPNPQFWPSVMVASALAVFFIFACFVFMPSTVQGRMRLKSLTAGSASLSLDGDDGETYFDKYLDEIAYFFSSSKKRVVIFEDIDRFDNTRIFEDLKELNTILNQDPSNEGRSICFVYAVRDSIFDTFSENDVSESMNSVNGSYVRNENVERANRTKFFDLIIPMVPFMSPTAAKGWISSEFKDDGIDRRLIRLLSKHITDMRLIKNIHNEFLIFRSKLIPGKQEPCGQSSLDVNRVLAMVAYKSVYPRDFEKLRLGTSHLDDIYRFKLQIVEHVRSDTLRKIEALKNQLEDSHGFTEESKRLGEILKRVIKVKASAYRTPPDIVPLTVGQYTYEDEEQLDSVDFWRNVENNYQTNEELEFVLSGGISIDFSDLYDLIAIAVDDQDWMDNLDTAEQTEIDQLNFLLRRTAHSSIQTVMNESDWTAPPSSSDLKVPCNLSKFVQMCYGHTLGSDLIAEGYISDDYQLYAASRNSQWISNDGVNFEIHNLAQGEHSLDWKLTKDDCEAIYTDFGPEITKSRDAYNVQFLDWLLNKYPDQAENMLRSPSSYDDWDREFYAAYLNDENVSAENSRRIVGNMAEKSDKIFNFLVGSQELSDNQRKQYTSVALNNLRKETSNGERMDEIVRKYLRKCDSDLECMQDPGLSKEQAELIANYYAYAGISLKNVRPLCANMLEAIKKRHNYIVNRINLETIFGASCDCSLNAIRKQDTEEYNVISNTCLSDYLKMNTKVTINGDKSEYAQIVREIIETFGNRDIDNQTSDNIASLIKRSKPNQRITDLSGILPTTENGKVRKIAQIVIRTMAQHRLFIPTPNNIFVYLSVNNPEFKTSATVDIDFDQLMEYMPLSVRDLENNDFDDEDLVFLATLILNSNASGFGLPKKIELVQSLKLSSESLDAGSLTDRNSIMFAELMKDGLLSSTADNFNLLESGDARTACIREWESLMEGANIPTNEIPLVIADPQVSLAVKSELYLELPEYLKNADKEVLESAVKEVAKQDAKLELEVVDWIAEHLFNKSEEKANFSEDTSDVALEPFIHLLAKAIPMCANLDSSENKDGVRKNLDSILRALPNPYPKLTDKTDETIYLPLDDDNRSIAYGVRSFLKTIKSVKGYAGKKTLQCVMCHND